MRKSHLYHNHSVVCQGRNGMGLRGEHIAMEFEKFKLEPKESQCSRCKNGKVFEFLQRQEAKKAAAEWEKFHEGDWEPSNEDWWQYDQKMIAENKARRAAKVAI